jgi:hypothetical protein
MAKRESDVKSRVVTGDEASVAQGGERNFFQTGLAMPRQAADARAVVGVLGSVGLKCRIVMSPEGKLNAG